MNGLHIDITEGRTAFAPGEVIEGSVGWQLDAPAMQVELRLCWFTKGRGTQDVAVVDSLTFDHPASAETRPFRFTLPPEPYSFFGELIALVWALELVALPSRENTRIELVIGPHGQEVRLHPG